MTEPPDDLGKLLNYIIDNKSVEVPAKTFCDTIIIEKDTTAIDVKESEVAPEIIEAAKPIYSMDMIDNEVAGTVRLKLLVGTRRCRLERRMTQEHGIVDEERSLAVVVNEIRNEPGDDIRSVVIPEVGRPFAIDSNPAFNGRVCRIPIVVLLSSLIDPVL